MNTNHVAAILVGLGSLAGAAAHAATATGDLAVSATVSRTCAVSAAPLAFGELSGTTKTASAAVTITCTAGSSTDAPTVSFDVGENAAGAQRNMIGGDSTNALVPYGLFSDSGTSTAVAANTGVATTPVDGGTTYTTTIWGSVPGAGTYQLGSFSDNVIMTVTYSDV